MPNEEYWAKRFEMLENAQHNKAEKFVKDMEKVYARTLDALEKDIEQWYSRLAKNNGISTNEAKKLLTANELKEFKWTVEEYIEKGRENAVNQKWMKQLENASARVHITHLQAIQMQLNQHLELWATQYENMFTEFLEEQYDYQYYHVAYEVAVGTNVGVAFSAINTVQLEKLLSRPWAADGYTFSERIWREKTKMTNELFLQLGQSLARGEGPEKTVDRLYKDFSSDNSKYQIRRVVMTESAFFSSTAQQDSFKELEVDKYEVLATLDNKTSKICQDLDGKVFDMSEYVVGSTAPPFHPFCRTVTIPYLEGKSGERFARDGEGNGIAVPSSMKYKEWYDKFVK